MKKFRQFCSNGRCSSVTWISDSLGRDIPIHIVTANKFKLCGRCKIYTHRSVEPTKFTIGKENKQKLINIGIQIKEIIKTKSLSICQISRDLGEETPFLSSVISGRRKIRPNQYMLFKKLTGIDMRKLYSGAKLIKLSNRGRKLRET